MAWLKKVTGGVAARRGGRRARGPLAAMALRRRQADYQPLLAEFPYVLPRRRFHE